MDLLLAPRVRDLIIRPVLVPLGFVIKEFVDCMCCIVSFLGCFSGFAPHWLTVHRFLQRTRGEVTKHVELSWTCAPVSAGGKPPRPDLTGVKGKRGVLMLNARGCLWGMRKAKSRFAGCFTTEAQPESAPASKSGPAYQAGSQSEGGPFPHLRIAKAMCGVRPGCPQTRCWRLAEKRISFSRFRPLAML